ncbi:MAG: hypothetical protein O3C28_06445 [Proteobacteria bacterium]|nr:hypothetical protein [Pseudomonadota bacterium]
MTTYQRDYTNDYDLDDPELSDNWDAIVADLHARCPIARSETGEGYWVLNGHDDVSRCAKDWRTFTSRDGFIVNRPPGMPYFAPAEIDPPLQRGLRRVLEPFLRQQTVADLEPIVRQHANALIDRFIDNGRVEAVSAFANPTDNLYSISSVIRKACLPCFENKRRCMAMVGGYQPGSRLTRADSVSLILLMQPG